MDNNLSAKCPECGAMVSSSAKNCHFCGTLPNAKAGTSAPAKTGKLALVMVLSSAGLLTAVVIAGLANFYSEQKEQMQSELAQIAAAPPQPPSSTPACEPPSAPAVRPPAMGNIGPYRKAMIHGILASWQKQYKKQLPKSVIRIAVLHDGQVREVEIRESCFDKRAEHELITLISSLQFAELPDWYKGEDLIFQLDFKNAEYKVLGSTKHLSSQGVD